MTDLGHPLVRTAEETCGGCPVQIEGTLVDGHHFYFRYRHGYASLGVGPTEDAAIRDPDAAGMEYGDGWVGVFESAAERNSVFSQLAWHRLGVR